MSVSTEGSTQEIELNLAPIIDCFTVLITYLLVTASFLTLTALDVSVSANSDTHEQMPAPAPKEPPMVMTIELAESGTVKIKVTGGTLKTDYDISLNGLQNTAPGSSTNGTWDSDNLEKTLRDIKTRWTELTEASISAGPTVKYKELVNLINQIQKTLPKVYISGG